MTTHKRTAHKVRVRNWAVDMSGDEPKLVYVYHDAITYDAPEERVIDVIYDAGGIGAVANNQNVRWLE